MLWVGGLLVVLTGLFGMHGLNAEGVDGMSAAPHSSMLESSMVPVEQAVNEVGPHGVGLAMSAVATRALTDMDMGHLCLAILVGSLIALLLGARRFLSRAMSLVPIRVVRAPARRARAPDPPSLIALSIQRC